MFSPNNQTGSILDGLVLYLELQVHALKNKEEMRICQSLIMDGKIFLNCIVLFYIWVYLLVYQ